MAKREHKKRKPKAKTKAYIKTEIGPDANSAIESQSELILSNAMSASKIGNSDVEVVTPTQANLPKSLHNISSKSKWVWFSTPATIKRSTPSVMAVTESIAAVLFGMWAVGHIGLFYPLLTVAVLVPAVLIRSENSTNMALVIVRQWERRFFILTSHLKSLSLTKLILHRAWIMILAHGAIAGSLPLLLIISVSPAIKEGIRDFLSQHPMQAYLWFIAFAFANLALLIVGPIWLLGLFSRAYSTACYAHEGFNEIPSNFRRLMICTCPAQWPEIVPGLGDTKSRLAPASILSWAGQLVRDHSAPCPKGSSEREEGARFVYSLFIYLSLVAWLLPSWLYRLVLKSTAWLWWPILLIGGPVKRAKDPEYFYEDIAKSLWGITNIVTSLGAVVIFIVANAAPDIFLKYRENPYIHILGSVFLVDWSRVYIWQWIGVAGAIIAIAVVYSLDAQIRAFRRAERRGNQRELLTCLQRIAWIERLVRAKSGLWIVFMMVTLLQAALVLNSKKCWLSPGPEVTSALEAIYGKWMPKNDTCSGATLRLQLEIAN